MATVFWFAAAGLMMAWPQAVWVLLALAAGAAPPIAGFSHRYELLVVVMACDRIMWRARCLLVVLDVINDTKPSDLSRACCSL